jgi:hypothetical protein
LAVHLQNAGPVIGDGDTVGTTPSQRILVRHGDHQGTPVYGLEFHAQ